MVNVPWCHDCNKPEGICTCPKMEEVTQDSRGHTLFVIDNKVGGKRYWSDEIGGGVLVWDTSLVSTEMLQLALKQESGK